jgi:hypothetical protein
MAGKSLTIVISKSKNLDDLSPDSARRGWKLKGSFASSDVLIGERWLWLTIKEGPRIIAPIWLVEGLRHSCQGGNRLEQACTHRVTWRAGAVGVPCNGGSDSIIPDILTAGNRDGQRSRLQDGLNLYLIQIRVLSQE